MLFHRISISDVRPGDHLYRWQYLKLFQGIAVQHNNDTQEIFVVIPNGLNGFRMITLQEFKGQGSLRRVLYDQGDSYLHSIKLSGTSFTDMKRPTEEVVQNALLLLNITNINPEYIEKIFVHEVSNFARLCCTMSHEQWRQYLQINGCSLSPVNNTEQISDRISIRQANTHDEEKHCCSICMDRSSDVAFNCGHVTCSQCAQSLEKCHICRQDINQKIRLFLS